MLPLQDHLAVVRSSTVRVVSITKSFETYISKLQWGISVSHGWVIIVLVTQKMNYAISIAGSLQFQWLQDLVLLNTT